MGVSDYARNWLWTGSVLTIPMRFYSKGKLRKGVMNNSNHVIENWIAGPTVIGKTFFIT